MLWREIVKSKVGPEIQQCLLPWAGRGTGKTCALPVQCTCSLVRYSFSRQVGRSRCKACEACLLKNLHFSKLLASLNVCHILVSYLGFLFCESSTCILCPLFYRFSVFFPCQFAGVSCIFYHVSYRCLNYFSQSITHLFHLSMLSYRGNMLYYTISTMSIYHFHQ